jgi:hypothetical protein
MNAYNQEQQEAITAVADCLKKLSRSDLNGLRKTINTYLHFREEVDHFLKLHFSALCTRTCYESRQSACCSREGITTFFADVVINTLLSQDKDIDALLGALKKPGQGAKCVYLRRNGCLWHVKPIVCEMFLCQRARESVFTEDPHALKTWEKLRRREKRYTWPSRPVLFDKLEVFFRKKGVRSSLMYFHNSPGLLRVKALAKEKNRGADFFYGLRSGNRGGVNSNKTKGHPSI